MMEKLQQGILTLVRCGITGEKLPLPEGFDPLDAYPYIKYHEIIPLAYEGALRCGLPGDSPGMRKLCQGYCKSLVRIEKQMQAVRQIGQAFDAQGVDYMPVKGCSVSALYPKPELRLMGDADILIRASQYDKIRPVMERLGFTPGLESDHEYIWDSPALHLELHKRLIPSYNEDYYNYFGDGWSLAKHQAGCKYAMSPEDDYIYLFTHFAKHYRDGGIGCRHVVDLWVYRRYYPDMDDAYLRRELEKLQLLEFYDNIDRLIDVWFRDGVSDPMTEFIAGFIFRSGSWGQVENRILSKEAKNTKAAGSFRGGKLRSVLRVLFPDRMTLQDRFPVLKKAPWLLVLIWPVNWVHKLLFRRDAIKRRREAWRMATPEKIQTYQQALNYVGLDFRFGD